MLSAGFQVRSGSPPPPQARVTRARCWPSTSYELQDRHGHDSEVPAPREHPGPESERPGVAGGLLSVNVGSPREVEWQGKTIRTAVWKEPVEGPAMARRINIDGDDQADRTAHGGEHRAVFVYQIDSYRYWEQHLDRHDFSYGQFGENFTVQGLADADVGIGDRY